MPVSHRSTPVLALAAFTLLVGTAGATVFAPIRDETLAARAAVILEGRILSVEPAPGEQPAIDYLVEIERRLKGLDVHGDTLVMQVPGGVRPDGIGLHVRGAPRFSPGDEALLFLDPRPDGTFALHQLMLGAFHLVHENGVRVAKRDLSGALRVARPGAARISDGYARDAAAVSRWLEQRAAGTTPRAAYILPSPAYAWSDAGPPAGSVQDRFGTIVSTTDPPPYGCGTDGGHSVRWFDFQLDTDAGDVGWRTHFAGQTGVPGGGIAAFTRALAAWSDDPNTNIRYLHDGLTSAAGGLSVYDGVNGVLFGDPNDEIGGSFDGEGLLAVGGPWFECQTIPHQGESFHPIIGGDIVTQDGLELFFAAMPDPENAAEQLFAHELGHTLGLAHSDDHEALMHAVFHPDPRGATLDVDDLAGAFHLYGEGELAPPAAPSELTAGEAAGGTVRLEWVDNSDDESVFRIERRQDADFELIGAVTADATSFIDPDTQPSTTYGYRLRAQNGAGASTYTGIADILTGEDRRPAAPTNLRAAPLSSTEIRLAWQDNSDDETGFVIQVLIPPDWVDIPVQLAPETTRVIVEGLPQGSTISFRLRAVNSFGSSAVSNHATTDTFANDLDCVVTGDELCLLGGRFKVSVDYRNQYDEGAEGTGSVVPSTDETGLFWFFTPENIELIVKALDGRHINQHFWLFYGALSDVEYEVTLTDTTSGEERVYHNPPGEICGRADTGAFFEMPAEPEPASTEPRIAGPFDITGLALRPVPDTPAPSTLETGSCEPGPTTLCLLDGRLSVEVWWQVPHGGRAAGPGRAISDSDSTGMFWFFNIENTELVVKALDGTGSNGHLWLFYGALTDLEYWITVTDTVAGESRVYYNPPGEVCGRADTQAFVADPPEPPEPPDDPDPPDDPSDPPDDPPIPD